MLKRVRIGDVNPCIMCVLCGGYLVDATTIVECLHSFCRSCIVKYLYSSFHCPVCDVEVHKTRPLLHIRSDPTLQEIVYKLVPGLYYDELRRRKEAEMIHSENLMGGLKYTMEHTGSNSKSDVCVEDPVCVTLEYYRRRRNREEQVVVFPTRYLRCPSAVTVGVLKKFLLLKFTIPPTHQPEIIRSDEIIDSHLNMKEVSQIYGLYNKSFLDLQYAFLDVGFHTSATPTVEIEPPERETSLAPNEALVKSNSLRSYLSATSVPLGENDLKPRLFDGEEAPHLSITKADQLPTVCQSQEKENMPEFEPSLPSPLFDLDLDP